MLKKRVGNNNLCIPIKAIKKDVHIWKTRSDHTQNSDI